MSTRIRIRGTAQVPWRIEPGGRLARPQIHQVYGGRPHQRISPCRSHSTNILLFADPEPYPGCFDGWDEIGRFHFAGEGVVGDQELRGGNLTLAYHAACGDRALRLFVPVALSGLWEYVGRFTLDPFCQSDQGSAPGVYSIDGPGDDGQIRSILIFPLVRCDDPATTIVAETEHSWLVQCERTGCRTGVPVPKRFRTLAATSASREDAGWTTREFPGKRWCTAHPPARALRALNTQPRKGAQ